MGVRSDSEHSADVIESNASVIQLMGSLGHQRGGLTKAVYERLLALDKAVPIIVAVTGNQLGVTKVFEELIAAGTIPARTELRAFFAEQSRFDETDKSDVADRDVSGCDWSDTQTVEESIGDSGKLTRHYRHGRYVGLKRYDRSGHLMYVEVHSEHQPQVPIYRDNFYGEPIVQSRQYLGADFKPRFQIHYRNDGSPYASHWVSPGGRAYRYVSFNGDIARGFEDLDTARARWLDGVVASQGRATVISDEPATMHCLTHHKDEKWVRRNIAVMHTVHYKNNHDDADGFKSWYEAYTSTLDVDDVVVVTTAQAEDLKAGDPQAFANRLHVIPHPAPAISPASEVPDEQRFRAICLGRLDKNKRVDHAILAVQKASERLPHITLDIYGVGSDEARLQRLVDDHGMRDRVTFRGYSDDVMAVLRSSGVQVFASRFEGFGLVLTEGFACGLPAIAYDVPYGPRDLVMPGINGELVESGDSDALASALVRTMLKWDHWVELRAGAISQAQKYGRAQWVSAWSCMLLSPDESNLN